MSAEFLVSGGAGFIGSNTVKALLELGKKVRVLDNYASGSKDLLPLEHPDLEVLVGDIQDPYTCRRAVNGVTHVLHMAAESSVQRSVEEPYLFHSVNTLGTLDLMEASKEADVQRFVLSSSCSVYGESPELPKRETSPVAPASPYALTKRINEEYCLLYHRLYGFPSCALRYFNVFGPGQRVNSGYAAVIPKFMRHCMRGEALTINGDGGQTRDFVYVDDVVRANLAACKLDAGRLGGIYNIGSGKRVSVMELAESIRELVGNPVEIRNEKALSGEVRHSLSDIGLAKKELAWEPETSLREGLERTLDWFRSR